MPSAKDNFIKRISVYAESLRSTDLISIALTDFIHNEKARMLRNGLSIIGFAILEDFIKNRTGEIFKKIGSAKIPFNNLPETIQEASTWQALNSILYRSQMLKRANEDYQTYIQQQSKFLANTIEANYELSEYSLGWNKPNLAPDDIKEFLRVFQVDGGWNTIQTIITKARLTLASPDQLFRNAASRRHSAAHDSAFNSSLIDLQNYSTQVKLLAFAYDVLISKSLSYIINKDADFLTGTKKTIAADINFRHLILERGVWKEHSTNFSKPNRANTVFRELFKVAHRTAKKRGEVLIKKKITGEISDWYI